MHCVRTPGFDPVAWVGGRVGGPMVIRSCQRQWVVQAEALGATQRNFEPMAWMGGRMGGSGLSVRTA